MFSSTVRAPVVIRIKSSVACYSASSFNFVDQIGEKIKNDVARKPDERNKGKYQTWKNPVYIAPHQHVFEQTPDFSFKDGRPVHVTSQSQLKYKLDQIRLTKKIISLLKETDEVEQIYKEELILRKEIEEKEIAKRPKQKGNLSLF